MPLSKGAGTEADGSPSVKYCTYCYQNGQFTDPDMTVEGMQIKAQEMLKSMHFPGFIARMMTKNMSKLERWSS